MTERPLPLDAKDRDLAVSLFEENQVVVAGAGSGKTSLLIERILNLLLSGREAPERILAVTFTEKAAGEMHARLAAALAEVAEGKVRSVGEAARSLSRLSRQQDLDCLKRRARTLLDRFDRLTLGTIHALGNEILRRHPFEAGLPPGFRIDEGKELLWFFRSRFPGILAEQCRDLDLLAEFGHQAAMELAYDLAKDPETLDLILSESTPDREPERPNREEAARVAAGLREKAAAMKPVKKKHFHEMVETLCGLLECYAREGRATISPDGFHPATLRTKLTKGDIYKPPKGDGREAAEQAAMRAMKLARQILAASTPDLYRLAAALKPALAAFRSSCLERGLVSYSDLLVLSRNLLRDNAAVRRLEAARYRSILVDEFQDTNPIQYELVFLLAASPEVEPEGNLLALPIRPGALFIVGDPKQSIYRFRGADITAYDAATSNILRQGGRRLSLTTSFRAGAELLDPINAIFEVCLGKERNDSVDPLFEPLHPDPARNREPDGSPAVEILLVGEADNQVEAQRRGEGAAIAERIASEVSQGEACYRDYAILLRSFTDLDLYLDPLRHAGIPYVVSGGKTFPQREEVRIGLALLRLVAAPDDCVAALALLRSPVCAIPDEEIRLYVERGGTVDIVARKETHRGDGREVAGALNRLRNLHLRTLRMAPSRIPYQLLSRGPLPLLAAAGKDGARRLANLRKLEHEVRSRVVNGDCSFAEAVRRVEEECKILDTEEGRIADDALDAVSVLTVHKAKGLEFPIVILPDLARTIHRAPTRRRHAVRRTERGVDLILLKKLSAETTAFEATEWQHQEAEAKRLLYVATTRACRKLLLVTAATRAKGWLALLGRGLGFSVEDLGDGELLASGRVTARRLKAPSPPRQRERMTVPSEPALAAFVKAARKARRTPSARERTPSSGHGRGRSDLFMEAAREEREVAMAVGTVLHELMEQWTFVRQDDARSILTEILAAGNDPHLEVIRREARRILEAILKGPLPAYLSSVEILGKEIPMISKDPERAVVHGYIDLLYEKEGYLHVADYKTDSGDLDHAALLERYAHQLEDYRLAVSTAMERPVGSELILLRTGERVALST